LEQVVLDYIKVEFCWLAEKTLEAPGHLVGLFVDQPMAGIPDPGQLRTVFRSIIVHGPHQVAEKSTTTGLPLDRSCASAAS
jgi:hypothetical protein